MWLRRRLRRKRSDGAERRGHCYGLLRLLWTRMGCIVVGLMVTMMMMLMVKVKLVLEMVDTVSRDLLRRSSFRHSRGFVGRRKVFDVCVQVPTSSSYEV